MEARVEEGKHPKSGGGASALDPKDSHLGIMSIYSSN